MSRRTAANVLVVLLAAGAVVLLIWLGRSDVSPDEAGISAPEVNCGAVADARYTGGFELPDGWARATSETGRVTVVREGTDDVNSGRPAADYLAACQQAKTARLWWIALLAVPLPLLLLAAGRVLRGVVGAAVDDQPGRTRSDREGGVV